MTYIDLLNNYWDSTRFNPCSGNEANMYFYLLHQCNIRRWINPFEFKTRNLEFALGITRASISAIRNKLKQRGLIDFKSGKGSGEAVYLICGADITNPTLAKKLCVQPLNTTLNTTLNTNANPTLLREDIRNKTEEYSVAGATRKAPQPQSDNLFAEEEKKAKKRKAKPKPKEQPPTPTLDDVLKYFLTVDADKRLQNWEESARRFYDNFNAVGWRDKFNRQIVNWDSRANAWILDDEKQQKGTSPHENNETDKFSRRRGTEPGAKSRKDFKGTF